MQDAANEAGVGVGKESSNVLAELRTEAFLRSHMGEMAVNARRDIDPQPPHFRSHFPSFAASSIPRVRPSHHFFPFLKDRAFFWRLIP